MAIQTQPCTRIKLKLYYKFNCTKDQAILYTFSSIMKCRSNWQARKQGITSDGTGLNWTQNNYFFDKKKVNIHSAETWSESRLAIQSGSYVNLGDKRELCKVYMLDFRKKEWTYMR